MTDDNQNHKQINRIDIFKKTNFEPKLAENGSQVISIHIHVPLNS